jgi:hypothetical protein
LDQVAYDVDPNCRLERLDLTSKVWANREHPLRISEHVPNVPAVRRRREVHRERLGVLG